MRAETRGIKDHVLDLFAARSASDPESVTRGSLAPPKPPLAKRLNRNALTVVAILMGMTVIASLVVMNGDSEAAAQVSPAAAEHVASEGTAPIFLDEPVRAPATELSALGDSAVAAPTAGLGVQVAQAQFNDVPTAQMSYSPAYMPPSPDMAAPIGPTPAQLRAEAFSAALRRSAIATSDNGGGSVAGDASVGVPSTGSLAAEESRLIASADSIMRSSVASGGSAASAANVASPLSSRRAFLQSAGDLAGKSVIARMEPASSLYVLQAGTVIPAILLTSITSDLPGDCMGQVARDIYDSRTQRILLIPKGSKLICRYDDQVVAGQNRLLIAWTRLLLPDGRSMTLPGLALKDPQGQTGAKGNVNNHTGRVFGRALLLSAIGAGAQLSQPRQASILAPPTAGQVAAGAVGQEMSQVALEVLRRGMDQPPTITVPQGQTFNVFLNGDLVFDGPYAPSP